MREIAVKFLLTDEQEQRLKNITEGYKKQGYDLPEEKVFEMMMQAGCTYDIDNKLEFHECKLDLDEKYRNGVRKRKIIKCLRIIR